MLYIITKKSGSFRDIKNIENIRKNILIKVTALVEIIPVTIWNPIPIYPAIAAEIHIDRLMEVSK